ncbi:MAG TPA: type II toxin-antitoxin system RelE/ParE family toxin, partial [Chitinophagales bacterium]
MGKRKVVILDAAAKRVAEIAMFIEGEGLPQTAKKFVDDAFEFFEILSSETITHRPCKYLLWSLLNYRCANFRKKYVVSYLDNSDEIVICDFALQ